MVEKGGVALNVSVFDVRPSGTWILTGIKPATVGKMFTVICVGLMMVPVNCDVPKNTVVVLPVGEPATRDPVTNGNPVPLMIKATGTPTDPEEGFRLVIVTGLKTVNVAHGDVRPRLSITEIQMLPAEANKFAGMIVTSWVALLNVVINACVAVPTVHRTTDPVSKPVPVTVSAKEDEPATTDVGLSDVTVNGVSTASGSWFDVRFLESVTPSCTVPTDAIRLAGTCTVIRVELTKE